MVAIQRAFVGHAEAVPTGIEAARADVERRSAGLSRALLALTPGGLRELATEATRAAAAAERRRARVGERPDLDVDADAAVAAAVEEFHLACAARAIAAEQRQRLLAIGNGAGLASFIAAGGLLAAGAQAMAAPVAVLVVGAAAGPVTTAVLSLHRASLAVRDVLVARSRWAAALEDAGCSTMGALHARRLAVAGWQRREAEAAAAEEAAQRSLRAWQLVAGPGVPPSDVEVVVERWRGVRAAQLRLLGLLLEARLHAPAPRPAPALVPPSPTVALGWFSSALEKLRGRKLHFS